MKKKTGTRKQLSNLTGKFQGVAFLSIKDFTLAEMMNKKWNFAEQEDMKKTGKMTTQFS